MDGVLITNEIIDGWKKNNKKGIIIKLDFEKGYDKLNWNYLLYMIQGLGFGTSWCNWIKSCLSSASLSQL